MPLTIGHQRMFKLIPGQSRGASTAAGWRPWRRTTRPEAGFSIIYPGVKLCTRVRSFVPGWEVLYPGEKLCTRVWNFVPRCEILYPGEKFCTLVWIFVPRCKILYPGWKFCTKVHSFKLNNETLYPSMKLSKQLWNLAPWYETDLFTLAGDENSLPGTNLHTWVWNFLPRCKTCEKPTIGFSVEMHTRRVSRV
jgi:hypothetical protein